MRSKAIPGRTPPAPIQAHTAPDGVHRTSPRPAAPDLGARQGRATRLGHRLPSIAAGIERGSIQRMLFYDIAGVMYNPETLSLTELELKLGQWQLEAQRLPAARGPGMTDERLKERIGQLQLQIEQTRKNGGKPLRAQMDNVFLAKHIIIGNVLNEQSLSGSIAKSVQWARALNTVLHLSLAEWDNLPVLAMAALQLAGYPADGRLIPFTVRIGVATEYREPAADLVGVVGNFGIYQNVDVTFGVRWSPVTGTGKLVHLENISPWAPAASYHYSEGAAGASLTKLYGAGAARIAL